MIIDILAFVGACFILQKILHLFRWRFLVNRDGDSGRYGHWNEESER